MINSDKSERSLLVASRGGIIPQTGLIVDAVGSVTHGPASIFRPHRVLIDGPLRARPYCCDGLIMRRKRKCAGAFF